MPRLNVTRVLMSREFVDTSLVCTRNTQTVGNDGIAVNTGADTSFAGVVTNDAGDILKRFGEASYITGSIMVHSKFPLTTGKPGIDADIVAWNGSKYTVTDVADYSTWGAGFTVALCTPTKLSGT